MKKKITALALCLIMCLTLVLASCSSAVVSIFDAVEYEIEKQGSYNNDFSFDIEGDRYDIDDNIIITTEDVDVEITEDDGSVITKQNIVYRVYNLKTGKKILEKTENYEIEDAEETDTTIVDVAITTYMPNTSTNYGQNVYYEDIFFVMLNQANEEGILEVYDFDGKQLLKTKAMNMEDYDKMSDAYCAYSDTHFVVDKVLYRIAEVENAETGALETKVVKVNDIDNIYALFDNYDNVDTFKLVEDKYIAISENDHMLEITVFNDKLEAANYYEFYADNYSQISDTYVLNNGNVLFYTADEVDVRDMIDGFEYDFVTDGVAVNIDRYVYDVASGSLSTTKDVTFLVQNVMTKSDIAAEDDMATIKIVGENIAYGNEIVDGKLSSKTVNTFLGNDGSVEAVLEDFEGVSNSTPVPVTDGIYAAFLPYGTYLYTAEGEKIGMLPADAEINESWIITDEKIYDFKLNVIYEIPKDYEISSIGNEVVYLTYYQEETADEATGVTTPGKTTYYVYTGADTLTTIGEIEDGDSKYISCYDEYYSIRTNVINEETYETTYTYEYKGAKDGKVLFTQTFVGNKMSVYSKSVDDGLVIIHETHTTNEETGEVTTSIKIHYITNKPATAETK